MNKKGMTLVEILVYIVLAGMLLAPVIMLVQNSSVNMARDASNVNLRMSGREILNIMYDDLRNTGFKLNNFTADMTVTYVGDTSTFRKADSTCNSPKDPKPNNCPVFESGAFDISSFMPYNKIGIGTDVNFYDSLTVIMGSLDKNGSWVASGIDTIAYFVDAQKLLKRRIGANIITLARNVQALKFRYSEDLVDWYDGFTNDDNGRKLKSYVQYIKAIMVTKDPKKLSPTKSTSIVLTPDITFVPPADSALCLYERHEIVIPIPNNGLFP